MFTVKFHSDETLEKNKAKVVTKGYVQTYGINYQKTYDHVTMMNTMQIIFLIVVNLDCSLLQFDVKSAFVHGELIYEVYIDLSLRFPIEGGMVCRLKKTLYKLKQSPRV